MKLLPLVLLCALAATSNAERINHEGRILGPAPVVTAPILFNTLQADAIVGAMQILPKENPWNEKYLSAAASDEFGGDDRANHG
jgi:hypothetical protein